MKSMNVLNLVEDTTIVMGLGISLSSLETILGITLLAFQIILIITKCTIKVIDKVKNKDINGAVKDIEEAQEEIDKRVKK